jgi:hypothetical protein
MCVFAYKGKKEKRLKVATSCKYLRPKKRVKRVVNEKGVNELKKNLFKF